MKDVGAQSQLSFRPGSLAGWHFNQRTTERKGVFESPRIDNFREACQTIDVYFLQRTCVANQENLMSLTNFEEAPIALMTRQFGAQANDDVFDKEVSIGFANQTYCLFHYSS